MLEALWAILGGTVGGAVVAFWTAYFGGYGGEKGKTLARKEDLATILAEIRQVTITQKEIKHKLSGDLWEKQNRWMEKKKTYADLLKLAADLDNCIRAIRALFESAKLFDGEPTPGHIQLRHAEFDRFGELLNSLSYLNGLSRLFLDPDVEVHIKEFYTQRLLWVDIYNESAWIEGARRAVGTLYDNIVESGKKDLKV